MANLSPRSSGSSRFRNRVALLLAVVVVLTVVPLASFRAAWWVIWTAVFAAIALVVIWRKDPHTRGEAPRFAKYRVGLLLLLLVPAYALVQAAGLGALLPQGWLALPGQLGDGGVASISVLPGASLVGAFRMVGYLILFALMVEVASRYRRVTLVARVLFAGVVLQALWALVALHVLGDFAPWGKEEYIGYATGTFVNRNSLATYLGLGLVLGIGLITHQMQKPKIRQTHKVEGLFGLGAEGALVLAGQVVIVAALLDTGSRAGVFVSALGAAVTVVMVRELVGVPLRRRLLEAGAVLLLVILLIALFAGGGTTDLQNRLLFALLDGDLRLTIYTQSLELIALRPLTGFGFDAFGPAFEAVRAPPLDYPVFYDLAHNTYITFWVEQGLLVGSLPILVLGATLIPLTRRKSVETGFPAMAAAATGGLVIAAMHSLVDFSFEMPVNAYFFTVLLALGMAERRERHAVASMSRPVEGHAVEAKAPANDLCTPTVEQTITRRVVPGDVTKDPTP